MMKQTAKKQIGYAALKAELDTIIVELQSDEIDVDQALQQYKRGLELVTELENHLKNAENTIVELKAHFDTTQKI